MAKLTQPLLLFSRSIMVSFVLRVTSVLLELSRQCPVQEVSTTSMRDSNQKKNANFVQLALTTTSREH
jgi:hypothetical protein